MSLLHGAVFYMVLISFCQGDVVDLNIPVPSQLPEAPFEDSPPAELHYKQSEYTQPEYKPREINAQDYYEPEHNQPELSQQEYHQSEYIQQDTKEHKLWANLENVTFTFNCHGRPMGFYADVEFNCQIFHMCDEVGSRIPHVCANETSFNQEYRICDWDYNFDCNQSEKWYYLNELTYATDPPKTEENIQLVEQKSEAILENIVQPQEQNVAKQRSVKQAEYMDYLDAPIVADYAE